MRKYGGGHFQQSRVLGFDLETTFSISQSKLFNMALLDLIKMERNKN